MTNTTLTVIGILIGFLMTILGSSLVFFFKKNISQKLNTVFIGAAAGIMLAASIWSLILPALEQANQFSYPSFLPAVIGIITGALFIILIDKICNLLKKEKNKNHNKNYNSKLFLAVTIHNIPEGLAVGFSFGLAWITGTSAAFVSAFMLALGIAFQNFPEGAAVSLPLKKDMGSFKAFLYGFLSGAIEPAFAVLGLFMASFLSFLMPWLLCFSAGAMLLVVFEELIPESQQKPYFKYGTWSIILGFVVMMILDVAL